MTDPVPSCCHGTDSLEPCPACEAVADELCAAFDRAVAVGEMDAEGYKPAERKARAPKQLELLP